MKTIKRVNSNGTRSKRVFPSLFGSRRTHDFGVLLRSWSSAWAFIHFIHFKRRFSSVGTKFRKTSVGTSAVSSTRTADGRRSRMFARNHSGYRNRLVFRKRNRRTPVIRRRYKIGYVGPLNSKTKKIPPSPSWVRVSLVLRALSRFLNSNVRTWDIRSISITSFTSKNTITWR